QVLQDCQRAWGQTLSGWEGDSPDCSSAKGLRCDSSGMITFMEVSQIGLTGPIPPSIGALTNLEHLSFWNNRLTGPIPPSIGNLQRLRQLHLGGNLLTRPILPSIGNLQRLRQLYLHNNNLTGSIPSSIGALTTLQILNLADNLLTVTIPPFIGELQRLRELYLHNNNLTGSIPSSIGALTTLQILYLNNNLLTAPIPSSIGALNNLEWLYLHNNLLTGPIPPSIGELRSLIWLRLNNNLLTGPIPSSIGELRSLIWLRLTNNLLTGAIPPSIGELINLRSLDLAHNYLTGPRPVLKTLNLEYLGLSDNYLSGQLIAENCRQGLIDANCFTQTKACRPELQRPAAQCTAFCGISKTTAACGGHGVCYPDGPSLVPTCSCTSGWVQFEGNCIAAGWVQRNPIRILPPLTSLTKGTKKRTVGRFMAKPVTLFAYPPGVTSRCSLELAFRVNSTFALVPQSGTARSNGFAFVIAAKPKMGRRGGVGYAGVGARSIAVVFKTLQNDNQSDTIEQHVGLSIKGMEEPLVTEVSPFEDSKVYKAWVDYEPGDPGTIQVFLAESDTKPEEPLLQGRLSMCAVLQAGVRQQAFSFGFVASTTVKPFQLNNIIFSFMQTGFPSPKSAQITEQARGLSLSEATFAPPRGSPFSRYVSADFKLSTTKGPSWSIRDFHTWDSVGFLGWPVKNQNDCNACWAYAVLASVEAAYGIAKQQSAPQLSVEALFALMGLSDSDKCSAGGSPTRAFEMLVALDASSGLTGDNDPVGPTEWNVVCEAR
ncbi:unnamed protein product, partial [Closterium sp. Naga37s-1]